MIWDHYIKIKEILKKLKHILKNHYKSEYNVMELKIIYKLQQVIIIWEICIKIKVTLKKQK